MEPLLMLAAVAAALAIGVSCSRAVVIPASIAGAGLLTMVNQLRDPGAYTPANDLVFFLAMVGAPALVGAVWRRRGTELKELDRLTTRLTAQRAAELRTARLEEQNRIASRVQNDLIQTMGAIVLRSAGAVRTAGTQTVETLAEIEESARHALDGLRHHIGVLREPVPTGRRPDVSMREPRALPRVSRIDVLAAAAATPLAVESVAGGHSRGPAWANVLAALVLALPLVYRRRHPVVAAAVGFAVAALMSRALTPPATTVSAIVVVLLLSYAVGADLDGWRLRVLGLLVLWCGILAVGLATPPAVRDPAGLLPTLAWTGLAVVGGIMSAARADRVHKRARLLAELEAGHEVDLRLATAEQRHTVARDLHDSVAATMTVVCLHAAAARRNVQSDPAAVRQALKTIEATARAGVAELRASLDFLDDAASAGAREDTALGIRHVIEAARAAGVEVSTELEEAPGLPPGVRMLAGRVVREALVNAARHAPGARVLVRLRSFGDLLQVEVIDTGSPTPAADQLAPGTGHGLQGLAERLEGTGGRLEWGAHAAGFRIMAEIPVGVGVPA